MNEQEVLELKAELESDFKKQSEAIDIVLELLKRRNNGVPHVAATPQNLPSFTLQPRPKTNDNGQREKRVRGILKVTRDILNNLTETFTSSQVIDALEQARPEFVGQIKLNSLRGVLRLLADEGLIKQIELGTATKPTVYRRIEREAEADM